MPLPIEPDAPSTNRFNANSGSDWLSISPSSSEGGALFFSFLTVLNEHSAIKSTRAYPMIVVRGQ